MDGVKPIDLSKREPVLYEADGCLHEPSCMMINPGKLRPSMFMPRWVSRLTLIVTDARVQRLQDITLDDICAEGLARSIYDFKPVQTGFATWIDLWDGLNAEHGFGWDQNPWVVAVRFAVHRCNIDQLDQQAT
jgi:hypothetical protein